ncbi:hypothetical protein QQ045_002094 [Rhodiola kirilowii]
MVRAILIRGRSFCSSSSQYSASAANQTNPRGLCLEKRVEEAGWLLCRMEGLGCSPNEFIYLWCCAQEMEKAINMLSEMKYCGICPTVITYNMISLGFCRAVEFNYGTGLTIVIIFVLSLRSLDQAYMIDFLRKYSYRSFPIDLFREIGRQLLEFMHDMRLIHTDLKPENILLVSSDYVKVPDYKASSRSPKDYSYCKRVPKSSAIKVIDFGITTYDKQDQSYIVSSRHYRAPETVKSS